MIEGGSTLTLTCIQDQTNHLNQEFHVKWIVPVITNLNQVNYTLISFQVDDVAMGFNFSIVSNTQLGY